MSIAYAPRLPLPTHPWLIEFDAVDGSARAFLADHEGNVLNVAKRHSPESRHASLRDACHRYGLHPERDLELRWWTAYDLATVIRAEIARLGIDAIVAPARPGVMVTMRSRAAMHLPSAFALRHWVRKMDLTPAAAASEPGG